MESHIIVESEKDLGEIAHKISKMFKLGDLVILDGELGTGKTTLIKHICKHLGINPDRVKSPSFSIHNVYEGRKILINHYDLYRIDSSDDIAYLNIQENMQDSLTFIEWGCRFMDYLADLCRVIIRISYIPQKQGSRKVSISIIERKKEGFPSFFFFL